MSENPHPSPQRRPAKGGASLPMGPGDAAAMIQREIQASVKWHLAREANAADIIHRLSYRVGPDSELAGKARGYGARLKLLVARIDALMPAESRTSEHEAALGVCSEAVIHSLDTKAATYMLVQFLLHHAETPSVVLMTAGEQLRSRGFERLWQRAAREREKIGDWVRRKQRDLIGPQVLEARESPSAQSDAGGAHHSNERSVPAVGTTVAVPRILYNPPQIVRWI